MERVHSQILRVEVYSLAGLALGMVDRSSMAPDELDGMGAVMHECNAFILCVHYNIYYIDILIELFYSWRPYKDILSVLYRVHRLKYRYILGYFIY